jgi:hypothetical protein
MADGCGPGSARQILAIDQRRREVMAP